MTSLEIDNIIISPMQSDTLSGPPPHQQSYQQSYQQNNIDGGGGVVFIPTAIENGCEEKESVSINNSSDVTNPSKLMLLNAKRLREKVIIYEHMCYRTSVFYTRLNKLLLYPSICVSSIIALLNSNLGSDHLDTNKLQLLNVIGNSVLTFVLTLKSTLKHAEKADYFFNLKKKFTSLHNKLNTELIDREISEEQLQIFMHEYENLDENIVYQFPDSIIMDVKEKFINCAMPTICNGIEIIHHNNNSNNNNNNNRFGQLQNNMNNTQKKYSIPEIV